MTSLDQIFNASLEDLERIAGEILLPEQRQKYLNDPNTYRDIVKGKYRKYVIKEYYKNGMLDSLSTWLLNKYGDTVWWFSANAEGSLQEVLNELK